MHNSVCEFLLAIYLSPKIGAVAIQKLLKDHNNNSQDAYQSLKNPASLSMAYHQMEQAEKLGIKIITNKNPDHPIGASYPVLYYKGNIELIQQNTYYNQAHDINASNKHKHNLQSLDKMLQYQHQQYHQQRPIIAIVGSRQPAAISINITEQIVQNLPNNYVIVSGLAQGIDQTAHICSYQHNYKSIGILATGMDNLYPKSAIQTCNKILDGGGLLISEYPIGIKPRPSLFARRNRFISYLANMGIIVIEAKMTSGTMMTAKYGITMNRTIYAVPGHPMDYRFHGCNALISQGATIIENPNDFKNLSKLPKNFTYSSNNTNHKQTKHNNTSNKKPIINNNPHSKHHNLHNLNHKHETNIACQKPHNQDYQKILNALSDVPIDIYEVAKITKIDHIKLNIILTKMYLEGYICINGNEITYNTID